MRTSVAAFAAVNHGGRSRGSSAPGPFAARPASLPGAGFTTSFCLPDLLGTQEGTVPQLRYLEEHLTGYLPLTEHRPVDPTCQYPTIFYRGDRFDVEESSEFWLSETPQVHRSLSWGSAFPRMATYGRFREKGRADQLLLHQHPSGSCLGGGPA